MDRFKELSVKNVAYGILLRMDIQAWSRSIAKMLWISSCLGQKGTPYEGGLFKLRLQFPSEYPRVPPTLNFNTPIYHPNVDERGRICISSLNDEWQQEFTASIILSHVRLMLLDPQLEYFLNPSIAIEYQFKKDFFHKTAKEWTVKFAQAMKLEISLDCFKKNFCESKNSNRRRRKASLVHIGKHNSL